MNARDIIEEAVNRTDLKLRGFFGKDRHFIHFESGRSQTIENTVTLLNKSTSYNPFPLVALFTEGLVYKTDDCFHHLTLPKIAIAIRANKNSNEAVRKKESFENILYPIRDEFVRQLKRLNFGYDLDFECLDYTGYTSKTGSVSLNQICDAVILKDIKMKIKRKCDD